MQRKITLVLLAASLSLFSFCCPKPLPLSSLLPSRLQDAEPAVAALAIDRIQQEKRKLGELNLVLIILDGLRLEEFFGYREFKSNTPASKKKRRRSLMPFVWSELASKQHSLLLGDKGGRPPSLCRIDNPYGISLPAYADILSAHRQKKVKSNRFRSPLACPTIADRLSEEGIDPAQMALFASWKHLDQVFSKNQDAAFFIETGYKAGYAKPPWKDARFDRDIHKGLMAYLHSSKKWRFLTVAYNDTDEWGHKNQYKMYLKAIKEQDRFIREIYQHIEKQEKDKSVYIITTDHGRGRGVEWVRHGKAVQGSQEIWMLFVFPSSWNLQKGFGLRLKQYLEKNCSHISIAQSMYWLLSPAQ